MAQIDGVYQEGKNTRGKSGLLHRKPIARTADPALSYI